MVAIDTDVLLLAFAFRRDPRQEANMHFLQTVRARSPLVAICSVMELLGRLSFNLSAERLAQWPVWLQDYYNLTVLYPAAGDEGAAAFFQQELVERPLDRMRQHPIPFLDALIVLLIEQAPDVEAFVTWNARHFRNKTVLPVLTPAEYLAGPIHGIHGNGSESLS